MIDLLPPLWIGVKVTVKIFFFASLLGLFCSATVGAMSVAHAKTISIFAKCYTEFFRGTSLLVQLFWLYFVLPLVGVDFSAWTVGVLALGLNMGAYGGEIVRGAVQSLPKGQYEAAVALNMKRSTTFARVIFPQIFPRILPPMGNLLIELLKATSLLSLITVTDLTFQAQMLRTATLKTFEIFMIVLFLYLAMSQTIASVVRLIERQAGREWI